MSPHQNPVCTCGNKVGKTSRLATVPLPPTISAIWEDDEWKVGGL